MTAFVAAFVVYFAGSEAARAQSWTSTSGSASPGVFNNAANWSNSVIPNSGTAIASITGTTATFTPLIDLQSSVTLSQLNFAAGSYTFTNSTANGAGVTLNNLTFTGVAAANVNLTQDLTAIGLTFASATSTLALVGSNVANAPVLKLGAVTVGSGASLVITRSLIGNQNQNRAVTLNQAGTFTASGNVAIQQLFGGAASTNGALNATFGSFVGNGNLTISGGGAATSVTIGSYQTSGDLNVYGATTAVTLSEYTSAGNINIASGTINVFNGFNGTGGAISFTGGSLRFTPTAGTTIARSINILASAGGGVEIRNSGSSASNTLLINGNISNDGSGAGLRTLTLAGQNGGNNLLLSTLTDGVVGNTLGLIRDGSTSGATNGGVWFLGGTNSFSGGITVNAAVLGFSAAANLGDSANVITLGSFVSNTASSLTLSDAVAPVVLSNAFRLTGTNSQGAIIRNDSATSSTLKIDGAATFAITGAASGRLLTLGGTNTGLNEIAATLANDVSGTTFALSKADAGTWVLSGANTFSGLSTLAAGTLVAGTNNALGTAMWNVTGGTIQSGNAAVTLSNSLSLLGNLSLSGPTSLTISGTVTTNTNRTITANNSAGAYLGAIVLNPTPTRGTLTLAGTGGLTILGTISEGTTTTGGIAITNTSAAGVTFKALPGYNAGMTVSAGSRLNLDIAAGYTITNIISGAGSVAFNPTSAVTATVAAAQTYSGTTSVLSGTLSLSGGSDRLNTASALAVSAGATVNLNGLNQTVASLSGLGTIVNDAASTTSLLTVTTGSFAGSLNDGTGLLALQKIGAATLTLNGTSNFTGGVTILNGTIVAGNTLPGAGNVTLSGGVLGLNGNLTISVGTGGNQLRWTSTGGVAAVGGDLTVRFETNGNLSNTDALVWGTTVQTGTFLINAQALVLGSTVADGRIEIVNPINLSNNTGQVREFLVLDNTNSANDYAIISGSLFGTTQFKKSGAGRLVLSGANTFSSTAQISGGVLQIGDGATTGSFVATTVTNNAVLLFNRSDNIGYGAGIISGTGALGQIGSGVLTLTSDNTYTGITTIGAGATLQLGNGGAAGSISNSSNIADAGTLIINRNNAYAYNGTISGVGSVVQAGSGTTTLGGSQTYSGYTSVANGTLVVAGSLASSTVTIGAAGTLQSAGGTLGGSVEVVGGGALNFSGTIGGALTSSGAVAVAGAGTVGTFTAASLILNGGSLNFDLAGVLTSDQILISGGAAPVVNATTTLNFNNLGLGVGTYQLIGGYGSNTLGVADFSRLILGQSTFGAFSLTLANDAGALDLVVSSFVPNLVWTGSTSTLWNTTDTNWTGDASVYSDGVNVLFDNTTSTNTVVIDPAGVAPASVIVNNDLAHTYTFSGGAITGSTGLSKQGAGVLVLTGDSTFTGGVNIAGGGTLQLGVGGTSGSFDPTNTVVLSGNSTLVVDRADTLSLTGNITGSGNLVKRGSGTLSLFGTESYSGNTTVAGGTLRVGGLGVLANPVGGLYSILGGTLSIDGSVAQNLPTITLSNGGTLNINTAALSASTLNVISGTVNVNNTLAATTFTLVNGAVNVNVDSTLSSLTTLGGGGAGSQAAVNIAAATTLTIAGPLTFDATGNPNGALISGPGVLSLSGARGISVADSSAAADDLTISATISANSAFTKSGVGALYLTGNNLASGVNSLAGGTLRLGNDGALGTGQLNITGTSTAGTATSGVLATDGNARTLANNIGLLGSFAISGTQNLNLTGTILQSGGARTIAFNNSNGSVVSVNRIILSETAAVGRVLTLAGSGTANISQITDTVSPTAGGNLIVNGAGLTLSLANANNYGGTTTLIRGSIYLGNVGSLGTGSNAVVVAQQGTAQVNPAVFTSGAVSFTRAFNVLSNTNAGSSVTFGGATADASSFSGPITFSSGLNLSAVSGGTVTFGDLTAVGSTAGITKLGDGTVVLSGASAYSGATSVAAGTLIVTGSIGSSAVSVGASATLAGTGALGGTVTSAGTISPGTAAGLGTLSLASLVLNGGSLNFRLDTVGTSDAILITGGTAPDVTTTTTLNLSALTNFGAGTYHLITGYSGLLSTTAFGGLLAPTSLSNYSLGLANNVGSLDLVVSLSIGPGTHNLVWTGTSDASWNASSASWSGVVTTFSTGDNVTFNNTTSTTAVTIAPGGVAPGSVVVNNDTAHAYTFDGGAITGSGTLLKQGTGTLTFIGPQAFTGPTTIAGGVLQIRGDFASSYVDVGGNTLQLSTTGNQTITGVLAGGGFLEKIGSGTTTLLGNNTFSGITSVEAGTLSVNNAISGTVFVNAGGAFTGTGSSLSRVIVQGGSGTIAGTQQGQVDVASGTVTVGFGGVTTGTINIGTGTLVVQSGGAIGSTLGIQVGDGTLNVNPGAAITGNGTISIGNGGTLNASGTLGQGGLTINIGNGGTLKGGHYDAAVPANSYVGMIQGGVNIQSGGTLDVGNSVGQLTIDGTNTVDGVGLTLHGGSVINFEFRNAVGTTPGNDWDFVDLGTSKLVIDANNFDPANQIKLNISSWLTDNTAHGANNFNAAAAPDLSSIQQYDWLFIKVAQANISITDPLPGSLSGRFLIVDDLSNAGVFGTSSGNPYDRPISSLGQGTFRVLEGNFGQGYGLYVHYSAIPEPGSMVLAGIASIGAGWYGRKRRRSSNLTKESNSTTSDFAPTGKTSDPKSA